MKEIQREFMSQEIGNQILFSFEEMVYYSKQEFAKEYENDFT